MRWFIALSLSFACITVSCIPEDNWEDEDGWRDGDWGRGGGGFNAGGGFSSGWGGGDDDWDDDDDGYPRVNLLSGLMEGRMVGGSRSFRGMPYAAAPVGDLRWAPPQAPAASSDVRQADQYGKSCAQRASTVYGSAASSDEDCLYMNVWSPADTTKDKLPVMVYIHGGDHNSGSTSEPMTYGNTAANYDGSTLAANGVVVASFNYRLGALGFLAHDALKGDKTVAYGNQGLWDQTFALQWIQDNIASFGGDPGNVTIFGQGSGASDVCYHMVSKESRGLFHQAISESGGCTTYQPTPKDALDGIQGWLSKLGCTGSDTLACLRKKPVGDLLNAMPDGESPFGPVVDGTFLRDQPRNLFTKGDVAQAPYILGSNLDEGSLFKTLFTKVTSDDGYHAVVANSFPGLSAAQATQLATTYMQTPGSGASEYQTALAKLFGDARVVCPMLDTAQRATAAGVDTYVYNFDASAGKPGTETSYGAELSYLFGGPSTVSDDQHRLSDTIQAYWTNFATYGDPNYTPKSSAKSSKYSGSAQSSGSSNSDSAKSSGSDAADPSASDSGASDSSSAKSAKDAAKSASDAAKAAKAEKQANAPALVAWPEFSSNKPALLDLSSDTKVSDDMNSQCALWDAMYNGQFPAAN